VGPFQFVRSKRNSVPDSLVYTWGSAVENVWYLIVFGYGAIVGSFLNVVIYRLPLGLSVTKPASYCPNCNRYLGFFDNIPLLGFLGVGGKCRYCRVPISWRYFTVELFTACLWVALFHRIADRPLFTWVDFLAQALFASVLIAAIFIDLDHFIVPDQLNIIGFVFGLTRDLGCLALTWNASADLRRAAFDKFSYFGWLPRALPGALIYGGVLFLFAFVSFVYYARMEGETVWAVGRRFFVWEDDISEDAHEEVAPTAIAAAQNGEVALSPVNPGDVVAADGYPSDENEEGEEDEPEPVRLRFSPGFICLVAACLLAPVIGAWAAFFFAFPLLAFALLTRKSGESFGSATARFFHSNDLGEYHSDENGGDDSGNHGGSGGVVEPAAQTFEAVAPSAPPFVATFALAGANGVAFPSLGVASPVGVRYMSADGSGGDNGSGSISAADAREEADRFALEAETGQHGGMGLGDVKLALAVGAMLGPAMALLSLFFATFVGAVTGTILARKHGRSLRLGLPFVPFMAVGAIIVMLYGEPLVTWYLSLAPFAGSAPPPSSPG